MIRCSPLDPTPECHQIMHNIFEEEGTMYTCLPLDLDSPFQHVQGAAFTTTHRLNVPFKKHNIHNRKGINYLQYFNETRIESMNQ